MVKEFTSTRAHSKMLSWVSLMCKAEHCSIDGRCTLARASRDTDRDGGEHAHVLVELQQYDSWAARSLTFLEHYYVDYFSIA